MTEVIWNKHIIPFIWNLCYSILFHFKFIWNSLQKKKKGLAWFQKCPKHQRMFRCLNWRESSKNCPPLWLGWLVPHPYPRLHEQIQLSLSDLQQSSDKRFCNFWKQSWNPRSLKVLLHISFFTLLKFYTRIILVYKNTRLFFSRVTTRETFTSFPAQNCSSKNGSWEIWDI